MFDEKFEEFLQEQVRRESFIYYGIMITFACCAIACLVMGVAALIIYGEEAVSIVIRLIGIIVMLVGFVFSFRTSSWNGNLPVIAIFLILNGIILHIPLYLPKGNKDARSMSRLDAVLMGIGSAMTVIPGVSRVGITTSIGVARGATPQNAYKWGMLISIPALAVIIVLDLVSVVTAGLGELDFSFILQCIMCGCAAYIGATGGISVMKMIVHRNGIENFSYYCWGAALFTFILYMI